MRLGPLVRLTLAGDDVLVLGSPRDAEELVSKPSSMHHHSLSLDIHTHPISFILSFLFFEAGETLAKILIAQTAHLRGEVPVERPTARAPALRRPPAKTARRVSPDAPA